MKKDSKPSDDQLQDGRGDKVNRKTVYLTDNDMERIPADEEEDYRMPRGFPKGAEIERRVPEEPQEDLVADANSNVSPEELQLLERTEFDYSSDETQVADLLDQVDEDGDVLNENSVAENYFDTGEDLDIPNTVMNPDINQQEEES
ncbi:hypothetical protein [Taibaiella chishuiensis]|uniref:Uncharacterized protein n=1 Tax=Taibaiella chishuiensis TaxID=1434707 RepID=A0A2P8CR26_9BACT|nr:hypothetical protein [Taibaiella chishuiensis]PSK87406.1 hypothetical protein B0I18_1176 [Taibaiella chishuiensis]